MKIISAMAFAVGCLMSGALAAQETIVVQSTTSTANSGLYDHLLPIFHETTGITVHVVAVGTGQAIHNATNCDGDVLLVHAKTAEEAFVQSGFGRKRFDLMYNDFVIIGPAEDPAGVAGMPDVIQALTRIANQQVFFSSRGDDSGTHKKRDGSLEEGANRSHQMVRRMVSGNRIRNGGDAECWHRHECLCVDRPRHLAKFRKPPGPPGFAGRGRPTV